MRDISRPLKKKIRRLNSVDMFQSSMYLANFYYKYIIQILTLLLKKLPK